MPTASVLRPTPNRRPVAATHAVYADLLTVHEDGSAAGRPLLTEAGMAYVKQRLGPPQPSRRVEERGGTVVGARSPAAAPRWDGERRRLWLGPRLLKEFRQPAPYQTTLLATFEEEAWAEHVADPLPLSTGEREDDARRRLHETIKNLNRGLPSGTIRFRGDGTGRGVVWEHDATQGSGSSFGESTPRERTRRGG
jgi:hypothetical protein